MRRATGPSEGGGGISSGVVIDFRCGALWYVKTEVLYMQSQDSVVSEVRRLEKIRAMSDHLAAIQRRLTNPRLPEGKRDKLIWQAKNLERKLNGHC